MRKSESRDESRELRMTDNGRNPLKTVKDHAVGSDNSIISGFAGELDFPLCLQHPGNTSIGGLILSESRTGAVFYHDVQSRELTLKLLHEGYLLGRPS